MQRKTVMITGQQAECTQERFDKYYKPAIEDAHKNGCAFVLGAAEKGCDPMAHALLQELGAKDVTVYDKGDKQGNGAVEKGWKLVNGFESYPQRDDKMLNESDRLSVYLFENAACSGTFRNLAKATAYATDDYCIRTSYQRLPDELLVAARCCARDAPHCAEGWKYNCSIDGLFYQ